MSYIKRKLRDDLIKKIMWVCHKCWVDNNKVVFKSFDNQYSCNPRAISEKLHELCPNIKIVWLFSNPQMTSEFIPGYVIKVKNKSLRKLYELATAKVWVDNCTKTSAMWKGQDQLYVQTWHGDKAFKKIGYDAGKIQEDFEKAPVFDLAIAGSEYGVRKYRNAFHYNGEILNIGTPRNDVLINGDPYRESYTRSLLKIKENVKILLYAPTFRDSKSGKQQTFEGLDLNKTINLLEQKTGNEWVCLLRAHHVVHEGFIKQGIGDKCVDVSDIDDIADLMLIADAMISDYSSCAGDFVLTKRPLILYQGDIKEYENNNRSFYFSMDDSPYFIAKSQDELDEILINMTANKAKDNCERVLAFYGSTESGYSAEEVAKRIINFTMV